MTCGPWRPVYLEVYEARISNLHFSTGISESLKSAEVVAKAAIEGDAKQVQFEISIEGAVVGKETVEVKRGIAEATFVTKNPKLWYPRRYGKQPLYKLNAALLDADCVLDSVSKQFGIRRASVVQRSLDDTSGTSFVFEINNVPIFCGGSNWIPADSFLTRLTPEVYREWVKMVADGNQSMLRVWGGGIYEHDAFYDACDEFGIIVWQDFMFACGNYPANPGFLDLIKEEAITNVTRLRHHPCIVLWAGNNEDYQYAESENLEYEPKESRHQRWLESTFPARYIYEKILADITAELVPGTCYHFGSPYGGKSTSDKTNGDIHQWNVWHGSQESYQDYDKLSGRFISEFGMQALPDWKTVDHFFKEPQYREGGRDRHEKIEEPRKEHKASSQEGQDGGDVYGKGDHDEGNANSKEGQGGNGASSQEDISEYKVQKQEEPQHLSEVCDPENSQASEKYAESLTVSFHNKAIGHDRRLGIYLTENLCYRFQPLEYYIHCTQTLQAESTVSAYRSWKRKWRGSGKEYCAGALVWQMNDCWPCTSWSIADYELRPKLAYYAVKREMESLTIGMKRVITKIPADKSTREYGKKTVSRIELWVCNFDLQPYRIGISISTANLDTGEYTKHPQLFRVQEVLPNRSMEIMEFEIPVLHQGAEEESQTVVCATLVGPDKSLNKHILNWPEPLKYAHLPPAAIDLEISVPWQQLKETRAWALPDNENNLRGVRWLNLHSDVPLKAVSIEFKGHDNRSGAILEDNGFDVMPGRWTHVRVRGLEDAKSLRAKVQYLGCERAEFQRVRVVDTMANFANWILKDDHAVRDRFWGA